MPEGRRLAGNNIVYSADMKDETCLFTAGDPGPKSRTSFLAKLVTSGEWPQVISHNTSRESIHSLQSQGG